MREYAENRKYLIVIVVKNEETERLVFGFFSI